jgi:acetylglutamate kinase
MVELRATDRLRRPPIRTVKTVVVKLGGARLTEPALLEQVSALVCGHWTAGERVVLVHGHGQPAQVPGGLASTLTTSDELATTLVTRGLLNTTLVGRLIRDGMPAVGLSGVDLGLVNGAGGSWIDGPRLRRLLEEGLVAVLAPVALSEDGRPVQTDPDDFANAVAKAVSADTLALLGDAPEPARHVEEAQVSALLERADLDPALRARLATALVALRLGVRDVRLAGLEGLVG